MATANFPPLPTQTQFFDKGSASGISWGWLQWFLALARAITSLIGIVSLQVVGIPANSGAPGTVNQVALDNDFLYVCVASNTWKRIPLVSF